MRPVYRKLTFRTLGCAMILVTVVYFLTVSYTIVVCVNYKESKSGTVNRVAMNVPNNYACHEKTNFVFIKCMKCATETLGTIIRRFGLKRNLNFVLPVQNNLYLGWPYIMEKSDYRPSKRPYNILMEHAIYNRSGMTSIMPNNSHYFTIIRHPWSRLVSSFTYFSLGTVVQPAVNLSQYLQNIQLYDDIYKNPDKKPWRICFPNGFSLVRNLMAHCLGMPLGFPSGRTNITLNDTAIKLYLKELDKEFKLVMLMEYLAESLVLLRRIMCWKLQDILYHPSNIAKHSLHKFSPTKLVYEKYKNFSHIDFMLYEHFNKSFWIKIKKQEPDFFAEVDHFKVVQLLVERFCFVENNWYLKGNYLVIPKSQFNEQFNVTNEECNIMTRYLLQDIRDKYNEAELGGNKSGYWYAREPNKGELPKKGCSYPVP